jgi:hypothetical protein
MTGLWVALSLRKTAVEIRAVLEKWFPGLVVTDWVLSFDSKQEGNITYSSVVLTDKGRDQVLSGKYFS